MTRLREIMLEELQRRNYAETTIRHYLRWVEEFARFFGKPPDRLGLEHLRTYQAYLPANTQAGPGFLSILHTWGQNLLLHPHIHCVIPAGGLAADRTRWISTRHRFLLPIPVLRKVFRGKFSAGLRRLYRKGLLRCSGPAAPSSSRNRETQGKAARSS